MTCEHLEFNAHVEVGRITKGEGGPIDFFAVGVTVQCKACGMPLQFFGLPVGIDTRAPTLSVDGLEARLVATTQGGTVSMVDRISATFRAPGTIQ